MAVTPSAPAGQPVELRSLADREQHAVAVDDELRAGHRRRPASAGGVGLAERHALELDAHDLAVVVGDDPCRRRLEDRASALLEHLVDLVGRGHVLHVAPVDERDLGGALPDRRARAVHRREAAADDDDARALVTRVGQSERRRAQVVEAVDHAVRVVARDAELVRVVAADRDADGVEALVLEVVEREVAAERRVRDELHAEVPGALVLGLEDLDLGKAVLRDPVAEHAAGLGVALEDRDRVAGDREVVRGRHAGRARADDRDAAAARGLQLERDRRPRARGLGLEHLVARVAVAVADRDRLLDLVAAAVLLAGCRADAAEHRRERDRALEDAGRLDEVALGVRLQEARDVDVARALVLAGRQAVGVVVAEDQLEVRLADLAQARRLRLHDHAGLRVARAGDRRRVLALDLDDAHPAGAEAGQLRLVAERRHLDAVVAADVEDRLALAPGQAATVDLDVERGRDEAALRALGREQTLGDVVLGARSTLRQGVGHRVRQLPSVRRSCDVIARPRPPRRRAGRRLLDTSRGRCGPRILG